MKRVALSESYNGVFKKKKIKVESGDKNKWFLIDIFYC